MPDSIGMSSSTGAFIKPTRSPPRSQQVVSKERKKRVGRVALAAGDHAVGYRHGGLMRSVRRIRATGLANAAFLLHHGVVPPFTRAMPRQRLNLGILSGSFLRSSGDALLQLNHREGTVAPGLDQITRQLAEGLIGVVGEDRDKALTAAGQ